MEWLTLLASLGVITLGAESLVRGASLLALRMGVSPLFVGLTIVGFGTSSPELGASVVATLKGANGVSVGNVIGSNIFNIGVIVGITALIQPIKTQFRAVRRSLLVAIAAAAAPFLSLAFGATLPRAVGIFLVAVLALYLVAAYRSEKRENASSGGLDGDVILAAVKIPKAPLKFLESAWVNLIFVVAGLILLVAGSRIFVTSALALARSAGISELLIGLTLVSAGTSLPELVTSVVAGLRRNPDIAVGNIIGSNIFNVFGILGLASIIRPQILARPVLTIDIPVMLLASVALVPIIRSDGVISRGEALLLLLGYGGYLLVLLLRGA